MGELSKEWLTKRVERDEKADVSAGGSERASAVLPTQKAAIGGAKYDAQTHMNSACKARDEEGRRREVHKPAQGSYDGAPIVSCAWCGKTLKPA